MAYIKSYSNYVLKKKHAKVNDGDIFERDITTIGGVDNFTTGQNPIYRSGSFLITVNSDDIASKKKTQGKWYENENGEVWNYSDVKSYSSDTIEDDKIVIKNDFRSLVDYAYYGSCSELVRASLNDILERFPGELYVNSAATAYFTIEQVHYKIGDYKLGDDALSVVSLGNNNLILVDNPFDIDIHTQYKNQEDITDALKFFCNEGYKNYQLLNGDDKTTYDIESWVYENVEEPTRHVPLNKTNPNDEQKYKTIVGYCKGDAMFIITLQATDGKSMVVSGYLGDDSSIIYMADNNYANYHIRPKKEYYDKFIKSLDYFESALLDTTTEPIYKATFEVFEETENGYRTKLESFVFPRSAGGYNIGGDGSTYNEYVSNFIRYTDFYDEHFSDNVYRMLTHESIKNFDWTYSTINDAEEKFSHGHTKIDQLLRLFGREFDELKLYIDGIKNYNQLTYNDNNNMPDYFLTDSLEQDGWDIKNIFPIVLTEYDNSGNTIDILPEKQLDDQDTFYRVFNQDLETVIHPYAFSALTHQEGSFIIPKGCTDDGTDCDNPNFELADGKGEGELKLYYFKRNGSTITTATSDNYDFSLLKRKVSKFASNSDYTYKDINAQFLKKLKLNSREIFRHKGTICGIEMMLGMFGLKSKNFVEQAYRYVDDSCENVISGNCRFSGENPYDYEIEEYTTFTNGILDKDWFCKSMPTVDWYNYTKAINYGTQQYIPYQGLPVTYRKVYYDNDESKYIDDIAEIIEYDSYTKVLDYYNNNNEYVTIDNVSEDRIIYPYFNQDERYDGNPYYQMNGGWIRNIPMMYDKYNNIISLSTFSELYTETVDTVKKVETVMDLFALPISELENGDVYYVENISNEYLLIDGRLYKLETDVNGNKYFNFTVFNHTVRIDDAVFDNNFVVFNPYSADGMKRTFFLPSLDDGYVIKAYMISGNTVIDDDTSDNLHRFIGQTVTFSGGTHYFKLYNRDYKNYIMTEDGWGQLEESDEDFIKINTLTNYFKGNNPHKGNMKYDFGYSYMENFARLFNYSIDNEMFDMRMYEGGYYNEEDNINTIGFKNLVGDYLEFCDRTYPIYKDSKIHYFGNYFKIYWCKGENNNYDIISSKNASGDSRHDHEKPYTENTEDVKFTYDKTPEKCWYDYNDYKDVIENIDPNVNTSEALMNENVHWKIDGKYYICSGASVDSCNYQIVNTKVIKIKFYLYSKEQYSKEYMEEIKYYQSIIMPYVEQMIPSTAIVEVEYCIREK